MKVYLLGLFVILLAASANSSPAHKVRAEDDDVVLRLFTRQNPTEYQILDTGDYENFLQTNFNLSNPVKFFSNGRLSPWEVPSMVEAFLAYGDVNVVMVDWTKLSYFTNETLLIENAQITGHFVSSFIDWIYTLGFSFSNVHIIGFSIGAHAAAYQARFCKNGVVELLTGLDPARSEYDIGNGDHLNANDAKFVEVIHTGSIFESIGDVDFYPNKGYDQAGCETSLCSHMRAIELFTESINSNGFVAKKCNSYDEMMSDECADLGRAVMGGTSGVKDISGIYYLTTNGESPFAQGDF